jgi:hypothetical protein
MNGQPLSQRFHEKFTSGPTLECWLWTGSINNHGYGQIRANGKLEYAHRTSYRLHVGSIPDGMCVLHRCDVPRCVNPSHLFLGTMAQNTADALSNNRLCSGERHPGSKLTDKEVALIRSSQDSQTGLARQHGVSRSLIYLIQTRKQRKEMNQCK